MVLCVCHNINEEKVDDVEFDENPTKTILNLFCKYNCKIKCGKCVPDIRNHIIRKIDNNNKKMGDE